MLFFLLQLNNILLCIFIILYLFIWWSWIVVIVNSAAINMVVQVCLWFIVFRSSRYIHLAVTLLDQMTCLVSKEISTLFPAVTVLIDISTKSVQVFSLPSHQHLLLCVLEYSHSLIGMPKFCEVVIIILVCISLMVSEAEGFLMHLLALCIFSFEILCCCFYHFSNGLVVFLLLLMWVLCWIGGL